MSPTDTGACDGGEGSLVSDNGFVKEVERSHSNGSLIEVDARKNSEWQDVLSYADILRSRNKFAEALVLYESALEKDRINVEAHIGKGICLQMQTMGKLAFESFAEAR